MTKPDPAAAADPAATDDGDAGTGPATETGTPTAGADAGQTITLTQAQLDSMVNGRTAQARRIANANVEKAQKYDELIAQQQTDAEKAQAQIDAKEKAAADRLTAANRRLIAADIRLAAVAAGIRPEAVDLVVKMMSDSDSISVEDDGTVAGVEAAMATFVKDNDYLKVQATTPAAPVKGGAPSGMNGGAGEPSKDAKVADALKKRDIRTAIGLKLQPDKA